MTFPLLPQLLLPLGLALWMLFWPQTDRLGLFVQASALIVIILASYWAGVWTTLPRWSVIAVAGIGLVATVRYARHFPDAIGPVGRYSWSTLAVQLALLIAGGWAVIEARLGSRQPSLLPSISLQIPLAGDDLVVANGGSRLLINAHQDTLDLSVPRHRLWQGQSYGVDLVALTPWHTTSRGFRPKDPARYAIFGRPVRAPCDGIITRLRDTRIDLPVPTVDARVMEGNFITLRCEGADMVMAHLKQGSIAVKTGQQIKVGDVLGAVGNSGMTDEPHLHIHAQTPGTDAAPYSGKPIIMLFNKRFLARNERI